jgi:hypothetical protein
LLKCSNRRQHGHRMQAEIDVSIPRSGDLLNIVR